MYVNELILTIVRRPIPSRIGLVDRLRNLAARTSIDRAAAFAAEKGALDATSEALIASLGGYSPRLLSVFKNGADLCSEPLEFLSYLFNADTRPSMLAGAADGGAVAVPGGEGTPPAVNSAPMPGAMLSPLPPAQAGPAMALQNDARF